MEEIQFDLQPVNVLIFDDESVAPFQITIDARRADRSILGDESVLVGSDKLTL